MKYLFLLTLFLSNTLFAFTLMTSPPARFGKSEITINVSNDQCTNTGFTNEELLSKVGQAIGKYWNKVSTSAIVLKRGSIISASIKSKTNTSQILDVVPANTVLVGCNDQIFTSPSTGGVGSIRSVSGVVYGSVAINDTSDTRLGNYSETNILALIGHEVGHAIGIGHSGDPVALMSYTLDGKYQEHLTEDDKDAITFLYPNKAKAGGFLGSCGTIDDISNGSDSDAGNFLLTLMAALLITLTFFKRFARLFSTR